MNELSQETHDRHAVDGVSPRRVFDPAGRIADFLAEFAPRTIAYMAMAAIVGFLAQAAALSTFLLQGKTDGQILGPASNDFGLASYGSGQPPLLVIRFSPQATSAEISRFLISHKAEVVSGPRKGNFYDVRVVGTSSKDEINAIVKQMQYQPDIVDLVAEKE